MNNQEYITEIIVSKILFFAISVVILVICLPALFNLKIRKHHVKLCLKNQMSSSYKWKKPIYEILYTRM